MTEQDAEQLAERIMAMVLDTYEDNLYALDDGTVIQEGRWARDMKEGITRLLVEREVTP